jgi:chromosome segregation ATPase
MRACSIVVAALALMSLAVVPAALAQTTRSGGAQQQNAQAMQQMQQLAAERTALQAENARLKQELEAVTKRADSASTQEEALKRRAQNAESASSRLAASNAASTASEARIQAQLDEVVAKFRETALTLKTVESERNSLRTEASASAGKLTTCREHNAALLTINEEILIRLENMGFWSKVAADEPFTRLKRIQLENLAAEYRVQARDLAEPAVVPAESKP